MQQELRDNHRRTVNAEQVPGWGIDADPKNDPTYPIKTHVEGEHEPYRPQQSDRPDQQTSGVEVLHSNERPNVSAVFGTTVPPSGLSGMIRRAAFGYSENSYGHWLPLMLADRVQMVEGVVQDLAHGHIPNVFSEMGWKAEWKHDRKAVITKVAVGSALAIGIYALLRSRRNRSDNQSHSNHRGTPDRKRDDLDSIRAEQTAIMRGRLGSKPELNTGSASSNPGKPEGSRKNNQTPTQPASANKHDDASRSENTGSDIRGI